MRVFDTIHELQNAIHTFRRSHNPDKATTVGFVPTMGYLHAGHESLLQQARKHDDLVVLSIFVNPLQFGPNEDFESYPRDTEKDLKLAERAGVDYVFLPSVDEMYPDYPMATTISVGDIASGLCGASRPGHFDGVATVVCKLFHMINPDHAYFGQKDIQQVAVLTQVVKDLNMSVQIIPCPIIREADGLALSSRNVYLDPEQRTQAVILSQALNKAEEWLKLPGLTVEQIEERLANEINQVPLAKIDYATVVCYPTMKPLEAGIPIIQSKQLLNNKQVVVALAVKFGKTRLIDNHIISL